MGCLDNLRYNIINLFFNGGDAIMEFSISSVEKGLQTLELDYTPDNIHKHISKIQGVFENALVKDDRVCGEISKTLIEARAALMLQSIQNCTQLGGDLIYPKLKITGKCKLCNGVGAVPMMEVVFVPKSEKCSACNGTGIKTKECSACNGTGRKGRDICGLCKGSKIYIFKKTRTRKTATICPTCHGSKYVGAYKTTGKIIAATICSVCKGLGQLKN